MVQWLGSHPTGAGSTLDSPVQRIQAPSIRSRASKVRRCDFLLRRDFAGIVPASVYSVHPQKSDTFVADCLPPRPPMPFHITGLSKADEIDTGKGLCCAARQHIRLIRLVSLTTCDPGNADNHGSSFDEYVGHLPKKVSCSERREEQGVHSVPPTQS